MRTLLLVLTALLIAGAFGPPPAPAQEPAPPAGAAAARSFQETMEDIHLLFFLRALRLDRPQLVELQKARRQVEAEARKPGAGRDTPEIRAAAEAVRRALIEGRPEDEVEALQEKLGSLLEGRGDDDEGAAEERVHAAARQAAGDVVRSLRPNQLARLIGGEEREEEEGGPASLVFRALRELREPSDEPRSVADVSLRISLRITQDPQRAARARVEIEALLNRILKLPAEEMSRQRQALRAEAEQIFQRALGSAAAVLQWQGEQRLAELLMHPRLSPLLAERLRRD